VKNTTNQLLTGLRFVAVVERFPRNGPGARPVQIVTSDLVPAQIAAQSEIELSNVAFPPELRQATLSGERMQVFVSVQEVRFANDATWRITPNPSASNHRDALGFEEVFITREFMRRQAAAPESAQYCRHENGAKSSLGLVIAILNEPGRRARCVAGRWEDFERQR
jgi:hypothetical protein